MAAGLVEGSAMEEALVEVLYRMLLFVLFVWLLNMYGCHMSLHAMMQRLLNVISPLLCTACTVHLGFGGDGGF